MKVWDHAGIKLATSESAAGLATECAMGPGKVKRATGNA